MRIIKSEKIGQAVYELAKKACLSLIPSCKTALKNASEIENNKSAKFALDTILQNAEIAQKESMPVCQDTGMSVIIAQIGNQVFFEGDVFSDAVNAGVKRAYQDFNFRKSVCDPITRVNTADNTPAVIHTEIVEGDGVSLTFLPKGFGSENMSKLFMLTPAQGVNGIIESIVETVKLAGSKPCPPVYIGVGIGGTFDSCAFLAKKALTREIGVLNSRADIAEIEKIALEKVNALKIGSQGFGGDITALGVACEVMPTHIAGLPVAVNIQCHCVRCASIKL